MAHLSSFRSISTGLPELCILLRADSYPPSLREGESEDYFASVRENASVLMVLTVAYVLEAGFGVSDGDQRNEDHVERVFLGMSQRGRCTRTFIWGGGDERVMIPERCIPNQLHALDLDSHFSLSPAPAPRTSVNFIG